MMLWTEYSRFVIALFAILTPFAAIPIFLSLTEGQSEKEKAHTARTAVLTIAVLLVTAAFLGESILRLIGTSLPSFRVGGGLVLLLMALSMMNARVSSVQQTREEAEEAVQKQAIGVVPIGIPLLAGPGSISAVIIQMERSADWGHRAAVVACILFVCALVWGALSARHADRRPPRPHRPEHPEPAVRPHPRRHRGRGHRDGIARSVSGLAG